MGRVVSPDYFLVEVEIMQAIVAPRRGHCLP